MNNITFGSRIRHCTPNEFSMTVNRFGIKNYVDYPWTLKESVCAKDAYTKYVADCTVCGITDGLKVLLIHLNPANKENFNFSKIVELIKSKFDLCNPDLQALLIGGKPEYTHGKESYKLFNLFENFLIDNKMLYSKLKGGMGTKDIAYSSEKDEWMIVNDMVKRPPMGEYKSPQETIEKTYDEVRIADCDELTWF